ncbi:uncharacterized protein LOC143200644 [Rhynchophorus ferrugineus]|uniref:Uncharacterized protein n=1 Tax=Rhynchophorus ferrugineus TaxID=354439 RepID=A0A834M4N7_RHYFE|nr:hypothetical protein GWI33_019992 [Rhynchophorus ferrugineus]
MPGVNIDTLKIKPDESKEANTAVPDPQEVRELTLTDRLNKRLLESFLQRLNQTNPSGQDSASNLNGEEQNFED